jgi:hypothetical protein
VIAGQLPHSDRMTTVDQLSTWNAAIQGGEIELVLAAIAASPGISKDERALLQAQALMRSNKPRLGYELLQREGLYEQQDTGLDVRLALIAVAARASANSVALQIFETLNLQKLDTDELESLLALHINGLLAIGPENVVQLLRALNPDAPILTSYRIQHAFTQRNYVELAIIANESTSPLPDDMRTYLRIIASNLTSSLPDYNSTIATIADRIPTLVDRAYLTCARDALLRKSYDEAIRIAIRVDSHANEATGCFDLVIAATRRRALERGADEALAISPALLVDALAFLARHLAEHPADASRREEVADLFLPESLGSLGNACLVAAAFSWFPYKPEILEEATPERPSISEEELSAFLRDTMDNFKSSGFALVGLGELDKAIEASTAILLLTPLEHMLDHLVNTLADDADVKTVILLLHIGCMTARRAGLPRRRLRWFRVVTTKLALAGWPQRARDLAEQLLQQAHDQDPTELRMAWAAFADVYFRTEDLHHALVGICAAFAIRAPLGAEELWQEFYLLVRVARSLGLWDLSRDTLARVSVILPILNLDYAHRIETIRLTIDFTELTQQDTNIEPHEYRKIVDSMVANLAVIEEKADELAPIIALLGQALTIGQNFSIEPTLHARDSLQAAMARMPLHSRERLLSVIAPQPTMNEILTTLRTIAETKHATDYGHDLYIASVAAKRALGQLANYSMSEAVVLFNLRADHNSIPDGHVRIGDAEALLSAIASLHNANQAVHMIALDQRSHMAHMILEPGHAPVLRTEPTSIFAHQALTVWQEKYPASYPRLPRDAVAEGIVFHSMARIGIGDGIDTRSGIVIIADDALQQIPANLLIADDNFLGISGPVTLLPSLDWYNWSRSNPRPKNHRRVSWIPSDPTKGQHSDPLRFLPPELELLSSELGSVLANHGFDSHMSPAIPAALEGADLTIIGAHGQLVPGEGHFQVIVDDEDRRWLPDTLAYGLAGAGVAILFVCSAGRLEHERTRHTVSGFVQKLFSVGCRTVLASPWPLSALAAGHWLPVFLDQLDLGSPVSVAAWAANQHVLSRLGEDPAEGLAMHVFGDPLQTISKRVN